MIIMPHQASGWMHVSRFAQIVAIQEYLRLHAISAADQYAPSTARFQVLVVLK